VLDVRPWVDETGRSVVNVHWGTGFTNIYRVGHKGKVDVFCVEPADGPTYYRDHLPILGEPNLFFLFQLGESLKESF
jgi:E3 ubiquitin-protein ligase mind-bomb